MFYKALGYAVWKLAVAYLRQRYGRLVKPAAAALTVALIATYIATRRDNE